MDIREIANELCNKSGHDCSWYHGNWALLKSLGLVSTSGVHEEVFRDLLKQSLKSKKYASILITGTTDEALLRIIRKTSAEINCDIKIVAVDICETPLVLLRNYAQKQQILCETFCSDILNFDSKERFDVILTHAFMGYFSSTERPALLRKWHELLSDNGNIVTIQRIRSESSPEIIKFDTEQIDAFIAFAKAKAKENDLSKCEIDHVVHSASEFAKNFMNYSIRSREEFEGLFEITNLTFKSLQYERIEAIKNISGPSVPSDAEFAHIIAEKRKVNETNYIK